MEGGTDAAKLVFYTNSKVYIQPFNLNKQQITVKNKTLFEKHEKEITSEHILLGNN